MKRVRQTDPAKRLWGSVLVLLGGLWMLLCGTCTAAFIIPSLLAPGEIGPGAVGGWLLGFLLFAAVGLLGAIPGILALVLGWQLVRPRVS